MPETLSIRKSFVKIQDISFKTHDLGYKIRDARQVFTAHALSVFPGPQGIFPLFFQ